MQAVEMIAKISEIVEHADKNAMKKITDIINDCISVNKMAVTNFAEYVESDACGERQFDDWEFDLMNEHYDEIAALYSNKTFLRMALNLSIKDLVEFDSIKDAYSDKFIEYVETHKAILIEIKETASNECSSFCLADWYTANCEELNEDYHFTGEEEEENSEYNLDEDDYADDEE